jgi:hypothetical protein
MRLVRGCDGISLMPLDDTPNPASQHIDAHVHCASQPLLPRTTKRASKAFRFGDQPASTTRQYRAHVLERQRIFILLGALAGKVSRWRKVQRLGPTEARPGRPGQLLIML